MSQGRGTRSLPARSEAPGEAGSPPEEGSGRALMPPAPRRADGVGGRRGSAAATLTWRTALPVRGGGAGGGDGNRGERCAGFGVPLSPATPPGAGGRWGRRLRREREWGLGGRPNMADWRGGALCVVPFPSEAGAVPCSGRALPGRRRYRSQRPSFWRGAEGCARPDR